MPSRLGDNNEMPFGKYEGTKMIDVPAEYLMWLWNNQRCGVKVGKYIERNRLRIDKAIRDANPERDLFEELIQTIESSAIDNNTTITNVALFARSWRRERKLLDSDADPEETLS